MTWTCCSGRGSAGPADRRCRRRRRPKQHAHPAPTAWAAAASLPGRPDIPCLAGQCARPACRRLTHRGGSMTSSHASKAALRQCAARPRAARLAVHRPGDAGRARSSPAWRLPLAGSRARHPRRGSLIRQAARSARSHQYIQGLSEAPGCLGPGNSTLSCRCRYDCGSDASLRSGCDASVDDQHLRLLISTTGNSIMAKKTKTSRTALSSAATCAAGHADGPEAGRDARHCRRP